MRLNMIMTGTTPYRAQDRSWYMGLLENNTTAKKNLNTRQAQAAAAPAVGATTGAAGMMAICFWFSVEPITATMYCACSATAGAGAGIALTEVAVKDASKQSAQAASNLTAGTQTLVNNASNEAYTACCNAASAFEKAFFNFKKNITVAPHW